MKSVNLVHPVKSALHAHRVKTASRVANVKSACVNCANLWMPLRPSPLSKNVRPAHPVKSVNLARHVKNAPLAQSKPRLLSKTKQL